MRKSITNVLVILMTIIMVMCVPGITPKLKASASISLSGEAHVQTYGDKEGSFEDGILTLGTTGQSKRLESIIINLENNTGYEGSIEYRVHRQTYGWTDWVDAGQPAGTTGESKRLEGIQIRLIGELAEHYSVKYRVHIQNYGWQQGWQYDGALAGTEAESKRLESLEIQIVPRTEEMGIIYRVHRQTYGWEMPYKSNGEVAGTTGESKRLEGIEIALTGNKYSGDIIYTTHVQSYGWMENVRNGMMSGTSGQSKRLEAIRIMLTGEVSEHYDIYYRLHAQSYGWLGWAKNGAESGTKQLSKRLEAIQIVLVEKGEGAPPQNYTGVAQDSYYSLVYPTTDTGSNGSVGGDLKRLILDPEIYCEIKTRCFEEEHASVLDIIHDPGLGRNWWGPVGTIKAAESYYGYLVDDNHFVAQTGETFVLEQLDWYCIHDQLYVPYMEENCSCKEFVRNQYGVIFFQEEVEYSRCKHENISTWKPPLHPIVGRTLRSIKYEICDDCGAIFDRCPHTNVYIGHPYYSVSEWSSTGVWRHKSVTCLDCEASCPNILEEIEPCDHNNTVVKEVIMRGWSEPRKVKWCDDCQCILENLT